MDEVHKHTWTEFIDLSENGKCTSRTNDRASRSERYGAAWSGTATYPQALELARKGWPEGLAFGKEMLDSLEIKLGNFVPQTVINYDVSGELLDIGRYCAHEPEHWGSFETVQTESTAIQHLHIVVNGAASHSIDSSVIIRRGATVATLISCLERAGYRVKLTLVFANYGAGREEGDSHQNYIRLKEYDDYLDLDRVVYALGHPSTNRRHNFSHMEQASPRMKDLLGATESGGYGRPCDPPESEQGDIYLGKMHKRERQWDTEEQALEWLTYQLRKQGLMSETV